MCSKTKAAASNRACDSCHRRKTRCVPGPASMCKRCERSGLTCTYHAIPKKKGPKERKAELISECRKEQRKVYPRYSGESYNTSSSPEPQHLHRSDALVEDWMAGKVLHDSLDETVCAVSLNPFVETSSSPKCTNLRSVSTMQIPQSPDVGIAYEALTSATFTSTCIEPGFEALNAEADFTTSAMRTYICAHTPASVPHATCALAFPICILGFEDTMRVEAYLPLLDTFDPRSEPLSYIIEYLSAFAWSQSSCAAVQNECRELLNVFARLAEELLPMVRGIDLGRFLTLLSRLGQNVTLKTGARVGLCGLSVRKAVVRYRGKTMMVEPRNIAEDSCVSSAISCGVAGDFPFLIGYE